MQIEYKYCSEEKDEWKPIDEDYVRSRFRWFQYDEDLMLAIMQTGETIKTPAAYYRMVKGENLEEQSA
jgi:hypothetical protein